MRATALSPDSPRARLILALAMGTLGAYLLVLGRFFQTGLWIYDSKGHPLVVDFLPVYVAGQSAWRGQAAWVYAPEQLHRMEAAFVGHPFAGYLGWHYPPLFFLAAMLLALLPYAAAFAAWTIATALGFSAVMAAIVRRPAAAALALALPPAFACAMVGQNGFFTAALLGGALCCLPRRPLTAGVLLALLTFKPQFGILIPFALLGGGHWRALLTAAALTLAWIGIGLWLSPESFAGFVHFLPQTSHYVLGDGTAGFGKLQTILASARLWGADNALAWDIQIAAMAACGALCFLVWRQRGIAFELKAACLCACCLLATPYAYFYDLPLLALPVAFLYRAGGFDRTEVLAIGAATVSLIGFFFAELPVGVFAGVVVLAVTLRRIFGGAAARLPAPVYNS